MEEPRETQSPQEGVVDSTDTNDYSVFTSPMGSYVTHLLGFIMTLSTLRATIYRPLIPLLSREFAVSIQAINLTITVYAVCQGLSSPVFASLADYFGRRPYYPNGLAYQVVIPKHSLLYDLCHPTFHRDYYSASSI